jgi:hypothetical protein
VGSELTISKISPCEYRVMFAVGVDWDGNRFTRNRSFLLVDKPMPFTETVTPSERRRSIEYTIQEGHGQRKLPLADKRVPTAEQILDSEEGDVIVPGPGSQYSILVRLPADKLMRDVPTAIAGEVTYDIGFGDKTDLLDFVLSYHAPESRWERIGGKMAEINLTDQPRLRPQKSNQQNPN